jgi:protocatechuate 3,4-dioxygenase beta subunit
MHFIRVSAVFLIVLVVPLSRTALLAQSGGNSTSVTGTVLDPSGAVVPGATVEIRNPVS